jgi:hypothetical protein
MSPLCGWSCSRRLRTHSAGSNARTRCNRYRSAFPIAD